MTAEKISTGDHSEPLIRLTLTADEAISLYYMLRNDGRDVLAKIMERAMESDAIRVGSAASA
jgi:glutamate/tyrosine decarboxylase-like PLP-dependent enzyme